MTTVETPVTTRALFGLAGFRGLLATRFAAQWADGLYKAGLAGAVLFNPERAADPLTIAGGFAALLLPYSVVGPFASALLDRWDRRRVLTVVNLLHGLAVLISAGSVALGVDGLPLFALALVVVGFARFASSGLSAALPHVVPVHSLVKGNAVATTLGAVVAVLGGLCAIGLRAAFGAGDTGSAEATSVAVVGSVLAAALAARFARGSLGPDAVDEPRQVLRALARGLLDGARAALAARSVTSGFIALFAHRAAFGISLLLSVLLMRFAFTDVGPLKAGLPGLGLLAGLAGAGILVAGFSTAWLVRQVGRTRAVLGSLLVAAAAQAGLGLPMTLPTVLLASFVITAAGQVVKLCVDASVQRDIVDERRGRVFALYETLFNVTQVAAVTVAALLTPLDGRSPGLLVAAIVLYLIGAVCYLLSRPPD